MTFADDIDWNDASSDFGLVQLCREMTALARPLEILPSLIKPTSRSSLRRRASRFSTPLSSVMTSGKHPQTRTRRASLAGSMPGRAASAR